MRDVLDGGRLIGVTFMDGITADFGPGELDLVEPAAVRQAEAVAVVLIGFAAFVVLCAAVEAVTGITL